MKENDLRKLIERLVDLTAKKEDRIHVQLSNNDGDGNMIDDYVKAAIFVTNKDGGHIISAMVGTFSDDELAAMFASALILMDQTFDARPALRDLTAEKMEGKDLEVTMQQGNLDKLRERP